MQLLFFSEFKIYTTYSAFYFNISVIRLEGTFRMLLSLDDSCTLFPWLPGFLLVINLFLWLVSSYVYLCWIFDNLLYVLVMSAGTFLDSISNPYVILWLLFELLYLDWENFFSGKKGDMDAIDVLVSCGRHYKGWIGTNLPANVSLGTIFCSVVYSLLT
jgi:hypothetical protein